MITSRDAKPWRFMPSMCEERRTEPRYPFDARIIIQTQELRAAVQARTSNLSMTGCVVDTAHAFTLGAKVKVSISTMSRNFEAEAIVVHDADGKGCALQFSKIAPEHLETLREWVDMIRDEATLQRFAARG